MPVRLIGAPLAVAEATSQWLRDPLVGDYSTPDYHSLVAAQVREQSVALRHTTRGVTDVIDLMLATAPQPATGDAVGRTTSVDLRVVPSDARAAADIAATIEHLAATAGSPALAMPDGTRTLLAWIADEIDVQRAGHPPTAYSADHPVPPPPCPLLRAAITHNLHQATIHAYRHAGFTTRQASTVRASRVAATLTAEPGASLDELLYRLAIPRLDLLAELGDLIELRAVFGIDHRWYPYDIAVLMLHDTAIAPSACGCAAAPV